MTWIGLLSGKHFLATVALSKVFIRLPLFLTPLVLAYLLDISSQRPGICSCV